MSPVVFGDADELERARAARGSDGSSARAPRRQRLPGLEVDDRLVVHDELVADQGDLEIGLHLEALEGTRVHERAEELVACLAGGLRGVHRGVRIPDHLVGVRLPGDAERDPDRRAHEQLAPPDLERDGERSQETVRHGARARLVGVVLQQDAELVPADPRDRVARPALELESLRGRDQQLVARVMPQAVVDRLEPIQIQDEDRGPTPRARGTSERMIDAVAEHGAVRQACERIVERLLRQFLLQELPVGDVACVEHETLDGRVRGLVADDALDRHRHEPSWWRSRYSAVAEAEGSAEVARSARIERSRAPSFSSKSAM